MTWGSSDGVRARRSWHSWRRMGEGHRGEDGIVLRGGLEGEGARGRNRRLGGDKSSLRRSSRVRDGCRRVSRSWMEMDVPQLDGDGRPAAGWRWTPCGTSSRIYLRVLGMDTCWRSSGADEITSDHSPEGERPGTEPRGTPLKVSMAGVKSQWWTLRRSGQSARTGGCPHYSGGGRRTVSRAAEGSERLTAEKSPLDSAAERRLTTLDRGGGGPGVDGLLHWTVVSADGGTQCG